MTTPRFDKEHWWHSARCAGSDVDAFFPERGDSVLAARALCAECPVRIECARYALDEGIGDGIFGGLTQRQRRMIRGGYSTFAAEMQRSKGVRCVECSGLFQTGTGFHRRKTCSDLCATRRGVRMARERLDKAAS